MSHIGRSFKRLMRLVVRVVCVCIVLALAVLLFPEAILHWVAPRVMPGIRCTVGSITWRGIGADISGLRVITATLTADVSSTTVRRQHGAWRVSIQDALVAVCTQPATSLPPVTATATRLPRITLPIPLSAVVSNLLVKIDLGGASFASQWDVSGTVDARLPTQVWVVASMNLPGQSNTDLRVCVWQSGDATGVELPGSMVDALPFVSIASPSLPVTIKGNAVHLGGSAMVTPVDGTSALTSASCVLSAAARSVSMKSPKLTIRNPSIIGEATLKRRHLLPYKPNDPIGYLMQRFDAAFTARADSVTAVNIKLSNVFVFAQIMSNRLEIADTHAQLFGGDVTAAGVLERRKVKDKDAYRFLYDVNLSLTNIDASQLCRALNLDTNRVEGTFGGTITAAGFGVHVKSFGGGLSSSGTGVLFFPESQKYLGTKGDSLNAQIIGITIERLREYAFRSSNVSLQFRPEDTSTVLRLEFNGAIDKCVLPITYHKTWIDAFNLYMSLK